MRIRNSTHMRISNFVRRLLGEQRGVAYLEFALALPFLILLFAGSIDITRMVLLHQKVDKAVFTVGDLATQLRRENNVCNVVRRWDREIIRDMIKPFSWRGGNFQFIMSSVIGARRNGSGPNSPVRDYIEWRYDEPNPNASSIIGNYINPYRQEATLPPRIAGLGQSERVIVTEMSYSFTPILDNLYRFSTTRFQKASYFRSRLVDRNTSKNSGNLSGC